MLKASKLFGERRLFTQLVEMLRFFESFEINNYTGEALNEEEMEELQSEKVRYFQVIKLKQHSYYYRKSHSSISQNLNPLPYPISDLCKILKV